jgi:hypothetical protein
MDLTIVFAIPDATLTPRDLDDSRYPASALVLAIEPRPLIHSEVLVFTPSNHFLP